MTHSTPTAGQIAVALLAGVVSRPGRYARRRIGRVIERRRMLRVRRDATPLLARLRPARRVLFVCHGNIIRSAFAGCLTARAVDPSAVTVMSAGLEAVPNGPAHPKALAAAAGLGVDLTGHVTRRLTPDIVAAADVILVMEVDHLVTIRRRHPSAVPRTFLLTGLAPAAPFEISDPVHGDAAVFERCFTDITGALQPVIAALGATAAV